jgi:murein DD-endopeptidase MepM/ murein hydrolase activator NlpD
LLVRANFGHERRTIFKWHLRDSKHAIVNPGFYQNKASTPTRQQSTMLKHSDRPAPSIAAPTVPVKRTSLALVPPMLAALVFAAPGVAREGAVLTPLILAVENAPVPFRGSDGNTHLVYELFVTNFSSGLAVVEGTEILSRDTVLARLDAAAVAGRLQPAGQRESTGTLAPGMQALLFVHVALAPNASVPQKLSHRIAARISAAPPGRQEMRESGGEILVRKSDVVTIGPPLAGAHFIAGDSCCDASRHTRAALPVDGRIVVAQRFAVDWEQLDEAGRIYAGAQSEPKSYTIYDKDVLAVKDATVVSVLDGLPDQAPGKMPEEIAIEEADGNSIVLDLGGGRYALYAHLRAGSIKVKPGDHVRLGQVMARVGNSGNTIAPHLHFHVMDAPIPLAANGLPYAIDAFTVTGTTSGTAEFDKAESDGTPLAIAPVTPPRAVKNALPLDQLEITFRR